MGKREDLIRMILHQYELITEPDVLPVVSLEEFFDGNNDENSLAVNIKNYGRPTIADCYRILKEIRAKPEVQTVLLAVIEVPDPDEPLDKDEWPYSDIIFVITSASPEEVSEWAERLQPTEVARGWANANNVKPPLASTPEPGMSVVSLWWD